MHTAVLRMAHGVRNVAERAVGPENVGLKSITLASLAIGSLLPLIIPGTTSLIVANLALTAFAGLLVLSITSDP